MRSCVTDVTGLLSDIIEIRDSMIFIIVKNHLSKRHRPVLEMLHRLKGISKTKYFSKQGGEGGSIAQKNKPPKSLVKPVV